MMDRRLLSFLGLALVVLIEQPVQAQMGVSPWGHGITLLGIRQPGAGGSRVPASPWTQGVGASWWHVGDPGLWNPSRTRWERVKRVPRKGRPFIMFSSTGTPPSFPRHWAQDLLHPNWTSILGDLQTDVLVARQYQSLASTPYLLQQALQKHEGLRRRQEERQEWPEREDEEPILLQLQRLQRGQTRPAEEDRQVRRAEEEWPQQMPRQRSEPKTLTDEDRAKVKLKLARQLAELGLKQDAEESYREIVTKHPDTSAADEARQLLGLPRRVSPGESTDGAVQPSLLEKLRRARQMTGTDPERR
jgi:hypothetical protein